jgi:cell division septal protein FtsQ
MGRTVPVQGSTLALRYLYFVVVVVVVVVVVMEPLLHADSTVTN